MNEFALKLPCDCTGVPADFDGLLCVAVRYFDKWLFVRPMLHKATDEMRLIRAANKSLDNSHQRDKRIAAAVRALHLCGKLTVSRERLTKQTITAANKARRVA